MVYFLIILFLLNHFIYERKTTKFYSLGSKIQ